MFTDVLFEATVSESVPATYVLAIGKLHTMDIANYSSDSRAVIKVAREVTAEFRHPEIGVEHLLIAVVRHEGSEVESILNQVGKSSAFIESTLEDHLKAQSSRSTPREKLAISPAVHEVLTQALPFRGRRFLELIIYTLLFILNATLFYLSYNYTV